MKCGLRFKQYATFIWRAQTDGGSGQRCCGEVSGPKREEVREGWRILDKEVKVKVKFILEQAMKAREGGGGVEV
jgi:hypothetical protein